MATYSIPSSEKRILQPNTGDVQGNVFATFNTDLQSNKGRIRSGGNVLRAYGNSNDSDFAGYAAAILKTTAGVTRHYAISDKAFNSGAGTPTSSWAQASTSGDDPDSGNTIMDAVNFDGLLLVSTATDIKSWNGSTWASWWGTTLSQSALTSGQRHLMKVGADGNLYVVDFGNKLYKVTTSAGVTLTGAGTLDFSDTTHEFTCVETSSNRLWIGTKNEAGEAIIIEWDMSPSSNSANRLHKMGARAVGCIAIWNGTPIALLSNGKIKYFNGDGFVDLPGAQLPVGDKLLLDDFVHPNGWDIIDGLPHFLLKGGVQTVEVTFTDETSNNWYFPGGIWCLDPEIGLYHRFAVGAGASSQKDYGLSSLAEVGALCAVEDSSTKFLCSYEYYDEDGATVSVLAYHDAAKTKPARSFLATIPYDTFNDPIKTVKAIHKRLGSGDQINLYYRTHEAEPVRLSGVFISTTQFNTTDDSSDVVAGYHAIIKNGTGAGQWLRVDRVASSSTVYEIHFPSTVDFVTAGDQAVIDVLNFKKLGTITSQQDWHDFQIPVTEKARRCQLLIEIEQAAGNKQEIDWVIINT
jgi:hypothetical protein